MMTIAHNLLTQVQNCFIEKNWTMATAESCTAGGMAYACTEIAGSSSWFLGGVVAYSNAVKQHLLAVESTVLAEYGAVSEPVALAMARGAQETFASDWAVSTSGVAGPGGGSDAKPVGMVCFAWVYQQNFALSVTEHFVGSRQQVREKSIAFALSHLLSVQEKIST